MVKMFTKGQGISINTIVITAIALLVLVVLATLLIRGTADAAVELETCKGVCVERTNQPNLGCEERLDGFGQPDTGGACLFPGSDEVDRSKVCCIPGASR